jgi:LSD1 subclass zinc finger protein
MLNDLVAQGNESLKAGDKLNARQLFISAIKQNPNNEQAWYGLYNTIDNTEQRIRCLQEILRINPANDKARQMLEQHQSSEDFLNILTQNPGQPPQVPSLPIIQAAVCSSCGAPLNIPLDAEQVSCTYCGAALIVQRSEGHISLKIAEKVSQTIQDVGGQTQASIREGTEITQSELKRLQITQEQSSLQIQLTNIQSEIRSLERLKSDRKIKGQIKELQSKEKNLIARINGLQKFLEPPSENPTKLPSSNAKSHRGCLGTLFLAPVQIVMSIILGISKGKKSSIVIGVVTAITAGLCLICVIATIYTTTTPGFKATGTAKAIAKQNKATIQVTATKIETMALQVVEEKIEMPSLSVTATPEPETIPTPTLTRTHTPTSLPTNTQTPLPPDMLTATITAATQIVYDRGQTATSSASTATVIAKYVAQTATQSAKLSALTATSYSTTATADAKNAAKTATQAARNNALTATSTSVTATAVAKNIARTATQAVKNDIATSTSIAKTATKVSGNATATEIASYKEINWRELATYPEDHIGEKVIVRGVIFSVISKSEFQMWFSGTYESCYVSMLDEYNGLYEDIRVTVYGIVAGKVCGKNAFGVEVCAPSIVGMFFGK